VRFFLRAHSGSEEITLECYAIQALKLKVVGSILIFVTALHSQCSGACPIELFLSSMASHAAPDTQPPCHRSAENSNQIPDKPAPNNDSCGSGPAIAANRTMSARTQSADLESASLLPVVSGVAISATFASVVFAPGDALERSSPVPLQKLVLRI
jgi:hypothetical protein